MTPRQTELVYASWQKVKPKSDDAAALFYGRLFELDPSLRPLFKGDMTEQGRKLMTMISTAVSGLPRLDALGVAVRDLGRRHAKYGVKDKDYATVGTALLWTLGQGLGKEFTPEVEQAWTAVYGALAKTMQEGAGLHR